MLGTPLEVCGKDPVTGFYRDGCCSTGPEDHGVHTVCAVVTKEFLEFTKTRGNDLMTAGHSFPGLKPGNQWCLCANRWLEAQRAGAACPVILESTHEATTKIVPLEVLQQHALKK